MFFCAALWLVRSGMAARELLGSLATPDAAVLMFFFGILFIYAEFNVPGTVVLGSFGALLVMLSAFAFSHLSLRPSAAGLAVSGAALILLELRWWSRWLLASAGMMTLAVGLIWLVQGRGVCVHLPAAIVAALSFGLATVWLGRIALLARSNKRIRIDKPFAPRSLRPSTESATSVQGRLNPERAFE